MSNAVGADNPAFANEDDCGANKLENGSQQQVTSDQDRKSSADGAPIENGHQRSFVSQHYVEPVKPASEPCYKTETRIELPADDTEKSLPEPKLNGVHGNGNNNDASFLNNSAASVQVNESGKKEQIEAVNLELVSMRPYTGNNIQTKGQEACEVPADPYEEYFVPVNEHRKYIRDPEAEVETTVAGVRFDLGPGVGREGLSLRDPAAGLVDYSHWLTALRGEKLYVTKDKRSRNSYWRKMAWGCALLVVIIAVIIAILAATGVILTQEATEPLENVGDSNTHQFSDVRTAGSQEFIKNPPSSPPPLTSSFPPWHTTDETLYQTVPNALDGILRLDDLNWSDDLNDTRSRVYRQVSTEIEEHLGNILQHMGNMPVIRVYDIEKKGEVKFRISYPPLDTIEKNREFIEEALQKNGNMIGQYHLNRLQVDKLVDQCEHGNLECTESCEYDYFVGTFACTCSTGKTLDQDGKTCVDDNDLSNVELHDVMPQTSTEVIQGDFVQGRSRDPNTMQFEPRHPNTWESPDLKTETDISTSRSIIEHVNGQPGEHPESTPTPKDVFEHDIAHWSHEHSLHSMDTTSGTESSVKASPIGEPNMVYTTPAIAPEPTAEPEPSAEPEPAAEPEPVAVPEPTVTSAEPVASTESSAQADLTVRPESTTTLSEAAEPKVVSEQEPAAEPESTAEPKPPIETESTVESITEIVPSVVPVTVTEPITLTESAATSEKIGVSNVKSETESDYLTTTESYMELNTKMSVDQSEVTANKSFNEKTEQTTQMSLSDATDIPAFLADSINENSEDNISPITTVKSNENQMDDKVIPPVIPLMSKNDSTVINDNVETKPEAATAQPDVSEDDKMNESTTNETDLTTLNYQHLKPNADENVASIKSENNEESSNTTTEQSTETFVLQEDENTESTVKSAQTESSLSSEHDLMTEKSSSTTANISERPDSITTANFMIVPMEEKLYSTVRPTLNNRHIHTIEINGISMNPAMHSKPKLHETTISPEVIPADVSSTHTTSNRQEDRVSRPGSDKHDSNEKNVIEHMPTTVFPKVPANFAHNVEPLKEPIVKPTDDEHIMLISQSKEPVELHAIIPELIPEQSTQITNDSLRVEHAREKTNNGMTINGNLNAEKSANDTDSSAKRTDGNIVHMNNKEYTTRPDETQEHSTSHPLHPAIFPENSVDHFAGKPEVNEDRHIEDMSPFLPDVHREKESAKKAPRLDKDEQDVPNPFETHIDDVITHRPLTQVNTGDAKRKVNETETKDLLNDVNSDSPNDGEKVDTKKAGETHKTSVVDDLDNSARNIIKNDEANNDTESKIQDVSRQDNDPDKTDDINATKETDNVALKVIPLTAEDKSLDSTSQTTTQVTDKKVMDESAEVTTPIARKAVEGIGDLESRVNNSEKPEENAVEDHYNDITDEALSKGYRRDHIGKDIPVKIIDEARKAIFKNVDPERASYKDTPSSTISFDVIKEKSRPDKEVVSDTTQSPTVTTKMDGLSDNQTETGRLTTQEPVLPIEIQQEMSTTIATDKMEITTVLGDGKREENDTERQPNGAQSDKEAITAAQMTTQSSLETARTTAQVPILPEELQTTETTDTLTTTSPMSPTETEEMKQIAVDKMEPETSTEGINSVTKENETNEKENAVTHSVEADVNEASSERSMAATTVYESNVSLESGQKIEHDNNEQSSTESLKVQTTPMTPMTSSVERTSTVPNDVVVTEDVRPVTEMVDDTRPMIEFDYRTLFATTTPKSLLLDSEFPEEPLTVIPLEKSQESKKKPADKKVFDKYKYKKDKDLNLENQDEENGLTESPNPTTYFQTELPRTIATRNDEELSDSAVSSDIDPSVPRFVLADTKGNILPISKLKNIARTDNSRNVETRTPATEMKNKPYPSFIPVSEEIIDSVPVTEPYSIMRNYTYHPLLIMPGIFRKIAMNETLTKGLADERETNSSRVVDARTSETMRQPPVTPPTDQLSDNVKETEADSVTKERNTSQLRITTTLDANVESVTTVTRSSQEPKTTPNTIAYSKCNGDQFQCVNGTSRDAAYCVPLFAKCDSEKDCSDGSDEMNCEAEGCSGNFRCGSGQCLRRHLVCNKIMDCDDGSDERDCDNWKCQSDEFSCPNGRCIPESWRCNGRPDCEGHQDEYNCAESCGNDEYLCPTEKRCIPNTWRCNGIAECIDGEDEKLCDCTTDQFECQTGGCIPLTQVCDSVGNCPDRSDEWACLIANTTDRILINVEVNAEDTTASKSNDHVPLLKIKQHNGDYQLICSDGWSEEFSDSYCRALGFAGAETTERSVWNKEQNGEEILRLKTNPNHRRSLVTNLEQVEFCVSEKVVRVSCQEFTCGLHTADGLTARSAGGIPASNGQWSSVALLKQLKHGTVCTATILGPMHALASYSCIHRYGKWSEWQLFTSGNMLKGHPVRSIIPYPQVKYNQFLYNNDIVLIEFEEPLILSGNISASCLPRQTIQPRQICVTAGWGFSVNGEMDLQQYLKFLPLPTNDFDQCNATSNYAGLITKHDICVGFTDKGSCYSDEGAPLMCVSESQSAPERWEVQGLLSHRNGCSKDHPTIYSSLEPALSWLRESVPALRSQS